MSGARRNYTGWAVQLVGPPMDGARLHYHGTDKSGAPDLFRTRSIARVEAAKYRAEKPWAFSGTWACVDGGTRVYQEIRVVKAKVSVEALT